MYLKKIKGPRTITLPDGTILSRADLPAAATRRWVASRKALVVKAVRHGLISRDKALERWDLSGEELDGWTRAVENHGEIALKATSVQRFRQIPDV